VYKRQNTIILGRFLPGRTRIDKAEDFFGIIRKNIHNDHHVSKIKGGIAGI